MSDVFFEWVKFKNFMSFGNMWTEVDLSCSGTTLLIGENLDNGGSSGAGKTTLISAIAYCGFDKIPSSVSKDKLINTTNERKNTTMEVCMAFRKGDDRYVARRFRGAQTGVQLLLNDRDITPASVNRGDDSFNAKLEEILGFSYRLFSIIILFNGNSRLFLDQGVGEQRATIEELFKITTLTRKANALKKVRDETDKQIALKKQLLQTQKAQNETYRKRVTEAELRVQRWEAQHDADLSKAKQDAERLAAVDFNSEAEIHQTIDAVESTVFTLDAELINLATERAGRARERSPLVTEHALLLAKIKTKDQKQKEVHKEYQHLYESRCPYCLQKYEVAADRLAELATQHLTLAAELTAEEAEAARLRAEIEKFDAEIREALGLIDAQVAEKSQQRNEIKTEINQLRITLTYPSYRDHVNASSLISTLLDRIEKLTQESNPHLDALADLINEGEIEIDETGLNELIKLHEHQQFLFKLLTDKNSFIRKNIISKTMPFLNKRIGYYTEQLNLPHLILFQADMSCEITQYGRELDHGNLSNGEKKKLNLALCLAFRDVLSYLHSKVNVLFTDEVDGGSISGVDVDALVNTLKQKAWNDKISIFIISHRPEFEGRCDQSFTIRKENGFSSLIQGIDM